MEEQEDWWGKFWFIWKICSAGGKGGGLSYKTISYEEGKMLEKLCASCAF